MRNWLRGGEPDGPEDVDAQAPAPADGDDSPLSRWLAPTAASQIDQIELSEVHDGWTPERAGETPLAAMMALVRAVGVVDPILLRPRADGGFEAVTGHRTVAAARMVGYERVPAVVREMDEVQALVALALDGTATGRVTQQGATDLVERLRAAGMDDNEAIAELLASLGWVGIEALTAQLAGASEPPREMVPATAPDAEPEPEPEPVATAPAPEPEPEPVATAPAPEPEPEPVAAAPEPEPEPVAAAPEPEPEPEPEPVATAPEPEPEPEPVAAAPEPVAVEAPGPEPEPVLAAAAPAPQPEPEPVPVAVAAAAPPPAAVTPRTRQPQQGRWIPLPAGAPRLAMLSSAFADTPRMLRLLAADGYTGVVELTGADGRHDVLTFLEGSCLATSVEEGDRVVDAPLRLPGPERGPVVEITVRPHPAPVVVALALAMRSPALLTGLHASFVRLPGLIEVLARERADAACVVTSPVGSGVILVSAGVPVAAYARRIGEVPGEVAETTDTGAVAGLLAAGEGEVDVHRGPAPAPLDLEALIAAAGVTAG